MSTINLVVAGQTALVEREMKMQRMLIAYILTGLIFLLLPGLRVENQLETRTAHGSCGGPRRENEPYGTLTRCGVLPESGPGV